jgi:PilZ domain
VNAAAGQSGYRCENPGNLNCEQIGNIPVLIADLSDGGAAIRCRRQLPTGSPMTLNFQHPHTGSPIQATAEVVWQDVDSQFGVYVSINNIVQRGANWGLPKTVRDST